MEILESVKDPWKRNSEGILSRKVIKRVLSIISLPWQLINIARSRYENLAFSGFPGQFIGKGLRNVKVDRLNCSF